MFKKCAVIDVSPQLSPSRARLHAAALRLFAERGPGEINVSELAAAAGVARGTVYNNLARPDDLFGEIAAALAHEMYARVSATSIGIADPAARVATGMRLFVRRAALEPDWGRFLTRFGHSSEMLRAVLDAPPSEDLRAGVAAGRLDPGPAGPRDLVGLTSGLALAAMHSVLAGHQGWREAGSHAAFLALRALGLPTAEARAIADSQLPDLAPLPARSAKETP